VASVPFYTWTGMEGPSRRAFLSRLLADARGTTPGARARAHPTYGAEQAQREEAQAQAQGQPAWGQLPQGGRGGSAGLAGAPAAAQPASSEKGGRVAG
jgi:hypothetical protein